MAGRKASLAKYGLGPWAERPLRELGIVPEGPLPEWGERLLTAVSRAASPRDAILFFSSLASSRGRSWLTAALKRPGGIERLAGLAGLSRSLSAYLLRHPEDLDLVLDARRIAGPRSRESLKREALRDVLGAAPEARLDALRRFRRREFLRIALRDLSGRADLPEVGRELSWLADAVLEAALAACLEEEGRQASFAVIAMGKLGGEELNYSSDIDLLFVYSGGPPDPYPWASRVSERLLSYLTTVTQEGAAFRVDLDLRPEGRDGPICRSLESYLSYYNRWAKTWELQALIKARHAAGDPSLGEAFVEATRPLAFPDRLPPEALLEVRRMKARLEREGAKGRRDLKHGAGGIRDVEFAVQLLQMVHGRRDPSLRVRGTLEALERLVDGGYVGEAEAEELARAYRFLRRAEHCLQLRDERRVHTVPADEEGERWVARALGFAGGGRDEVEVFREVWRETLAVTRRVFEKLFFRPLLDAVASVPASRGLDEEARAERLRLIGFRNPGQASKTLLSLATGLSRRARVLRDALPVILPWFAEAADPDVALTSFAQLARKYGEDASFLALVRENPTPAMQLLRYLGRGQVVGDAMLRSPEWIQYLLNPGSLDAPPTREGLVKEALASLAWHAPEARLDALRRFRRREFLRIALRDLSGRADLPEVGRELSWLADAVLEAALAACLEEEGRQASFAVIAMGKLGGEELNYSSDIDLLFVYSGGPPDPYPWASRVSERLLSYLTTVTQEGAAFRVDLDLRPEGRDGPICRSLESYLSYYNRWAKTWELQALIKARHAAGDPSLGEAFVEATRPLAFPDRLPPEALLEVRRMKARLEREKVGRPAELDLKFGPGGISDVEFAVQLAQMRWGGREERLRARGTLDALRAAAEGGFLDAREAKNLEEAWRFQVRVRSALFFLKGRALDLLPSVPEEQETLARSLGFPPPARQAFMDRLRSVRRRARSAFEAAFYG